MAQNAGDPLAMSPIQNADHDTRIMGVKTNLGTSLAHVAPCDTPLKEIRCRLTCVMSKLPAVACNLKAECEHVSTGQLASVHAKIHPSLGPVMCTRIDLALWSNGSLTGVFPAFDELTWGRRSFPH